MKKVNVNIDGKIKKISLESVVENWSKRYPKIINLESNISDSKILQNEEIEGTKEKIKYLILIPLLKKLKIFNLAKKIINFNFNSYLNKTNDKIDDLEIKIDRIENELKDILNQVYKIKPIDTNQSVFLKTFSKISDDNIDHILPSGTMTDNTRMPRFVLACENYFKRKCNYLDLGCAGGGLVRNFLEFDNFALGIEGSDLSMKENRAEWGRIPSFLFVADIAKKFSFDNKQTNKKCMFDVIGAWEVLEHIHKDNHEQLFENIFSHLNPGGFFVASISSNNLTHHICANNSEWWIKNFKKHNLKILNLNKFFEPADLPRNELVEHNFYIFLSK